MSKSSKEQADALRSQLTQLRSEAKISRKRISETAKDLIEYCEANKPKDHLIVGIPESQNPWNEKKSCTVL